MAKRPTPPDRPLRRRPRAAQVRPPDLGQAAAPARRQGRGRRPLAAEPQRPGPSRRRADARRRRRRCADAFALPGADQRQMLETLSLNLARAAMTAQSAIAEAALRQADRPAALSPDPFNVGPAMNSVMTSLASRPDKLFAAQADLFNRYMDLWATTTRRAAGEEPPPRRPRTSGSRTPPGPRTRCSTSCASPIWSPPTG